MNIINFHRACREPGYNILIYVKYDSLCEKYILYFKILCMSCEYKHALLHLN